MSAATTTTVKVRTSTRDLLRSIGAARHQSADQVILAAWLLCSETSAARSLPQRREPLLTTPPTSPRSARSKTTSPLSMRGEVYRLPARDKGHEQRGRRYTVVLQPDWLASSTWIVAFTNTSARPTSFRPPVVIADSETLVMCDQLATVDLNRLSEQAGILNLQEMRRIDEATSLVLHL